MLDVVNVNPEVEELMFTGLNVLMTSIQMLALDSLLHNVTNFANEDFKANPNKDTMMNYLFNFILMKRRAVERRTSLYHRSRRPAPLPSPEEDEPQRAS